MRKLYPILSVFLLSIAWWPGAFAQSIYYVKSDAPGANNGASWNDAFTSLQAALDAAATGDQVWVAAGTYKPAKDIHGNASPASNRDKTFLLKNGVKLYGGFAGTEDNLNDRTKSSIAENPTILSGDLNGNDGDNFANYSENAYHILIANALTSSTLLDGFIIKGGNASASGDFLGLGSGAAFGGGLFINNSGANLTVNNCVFTSNSASVYAGGIFMNASSPSFQNCVVENNKSGFGGGLHLLGSFPTFVNSVFVKNSASYGGALLNNSSSTSSFINCTFYGNSGTTQGGAITNFNGSRSHLKNCIVWGNTSPDGPAFYGAGTLTTATYSNIQGGFAGEGNIKVDPIFSAPHDPDGADNIWMTADDGLTLREISPSVNAGLNSDVPVGIVDDILGDDRFQSVVNMGAYEKVTPSVTLFVNANASGANNGTSWEDAFTSLQTALDAAVSGDQVWVAAGTYKPAKDIDGNASPASARSKTFLVKNGVKLYGGFAGTEDDLNDRTKSSIAENPTILSGDLNGNDGDNFANYNDNVYHILIANALTSSTLLDGFIIRGGNASASGDFLGISSGAGFGGGLFINNSGANLTVNNCVFTSNSASIYAGGIFMNASSPSFQNCVVENNKSGFGGGLHLLSSFPTFVNSVFVKNSASYGGALLNNSSSTSTFINCTFYGNSGTTQGGAITNFNGSRSHLKNCIVWGNTSPDGPAFYGAGTLTTATYSNIQGGFDGVGNIKADPIFSGPHDPDGADNIWMTADDGLSLREISPSANAGLNSDVPVGIVDDILGDNRFQSVVNMGAYENVTPSVTLFVNANASGANNGTSWEDAFTSLQTALDAAATGDHVWVAAGTYKPSKDIDGNASPASARNKTFLLKNGVKMYGGFAGTEVHLNDRTKSSIAENPTILSGDLNGNDGDNFANYSENAYHILVANALTSSTLLDGFIIKGGNASASGDFLGLGSGAAFGGGLFINNSGANLTVNNCVFSANSASVYAGGIFMNASSPSFQNCVVENNKSGFGGGLHLLSSFPTFVNSVFVKNSASYGGALLNNSSSTSTFINCTFYGNNGTTQGGAITNFNGSRSHLKNCIVWGNTSEEGPAFYGAGTLTTAIYSNIQGGFAGEGNIDTDPIFNDVEDLDGPDDRWMTEDDGLTFLADAPGANTGNNEAVANIVWDIVGDMRILDSQVNMGAYENLGKITPALVWSTPSAIVYGTALSGTQLNASLTIAGSIEYFIDATKTQNASGKILPVGTHFLYAVVTPDDASTYNPMQAIVSLTVTQAPITVTANAVEKNYGDTDPELTYSVTSGALLEGDEFSGSLSRTAGEDVGSYLISQNTLALNANYSLTFVADNLVINERPVTITADAKSKAYGDVDPELTYAITSGSLIGMDVVSGSLARVTGEVPGDYTIGQNTLSLNSNYALTYVSNNLTITKRPVTVTADPKWKEYGDADPELSYSITEGSLLSADEFSGALSRAAGEELGTYSIEQNTFTINDYYDLTFVSADLTIEQRLITVTANEIEKIYGEVDPTLTYAITSGSILDGDEFTGTLEREIGEDTGVYNINQNTLALNDNYALTFVSNTLTITPRPITVSTDAVSKTYGDEDPALTYSITSGSLVEGDSFTGSLNRIPGENAGTYSINQNTLALNGNYNLTFVPEALTIKPRAIQVTANALTKTYGTTDPSLTYTITSGSLINGDRFTGSISREGGSNVGEYTIKQNTLSLGSNYELTYVSNIFTITKRAITVTAEESAKQYGDEDPTFPYSVTSGSLVNGDAFTGSIGRTAGEALGSYDLVQNTLSAGANYELTFVSNKFSITPRIITVTADAVSKKYGEADPALTYTITSGSLVDGDMLTGTLIREAGENVGTYAIHQGSLASDDEYILTFVGEDFTIEKATQVITFAEFGDVEFGQEPFTLEAESSSGLAITYSSSNTDVATIDGNLITIIGRGTVVITATQAGDSNYLNAAVEQTLIVKGAIATIDQTSLSFGHVLVSAEKVKTITITNSGNADLKILDVTYPAGFTGNIVTTTIAPGATKSIEIKFMPTAIETYAGTIQFTVNTPEGIVMIETSGEGTNVTSAETDLDKTVTLSPNPANDVLTIEVKSAQGEANFQVYDVNGNAVSLYFEKIATGAYTANVGSLNAGVYFVTLRDGNQTVTKRFVKL